jgi:hypothetical protein
MMDDNKVFGSFERIFPWMMNKEEDDVSCHVNIHVSCHISQVDTLG